MIIRKTKIKGVYIIKQEPRTDPRGYFSRIFAKEELKKKESGLTLYTGTDLLQKIGV